MFEGKKIKAFLAHYKLYADALNPTRQKRSLFIHQYILKMVSTIIHHHPSTSSSDWASIKALLISIYHNEEEEPSTQNETCEDIYEVTINDTTTTPPASNDHTHLESIAKPITTPSVGICHVHLESVDEPTAIPPATDLITTNAEVNTFLQTTIHLSAQITLTANLSTNQPITLPSELTTSISNPLVNRLPFLLLLT
ncbi:hypothetical protein EV182_002621 [Spiromyces aspiralis]|uniref:Uncharacterized protein n=1 Tax=Spiromyces aspiralis TaxID=68401 RepID=A0ACC1HSZ4_9FUNG|nr:hypothetical protein EV182_002621 [Spiromyces aspiralis]